jgi:hypothetical protein
MGDADGTSLVANQYCDTIWQKIKLLPCTGGITKNSQETEISIFPNPSKDFLSIKSNLKINKIEIYDMTGIHYVLPSKNNLINIESLEKGIYFLKVNSDSEEQIKKFIKE